MAYMPWLSAGFPRANERWICTHREIPPSWPGVETKPPAAYADTKTSDRLYALIAGRDLHANIIADSFPER